MSKIAIRGTLDVHENMRDAVKDVVHRCVARVRENEPGTLQYDWYATEDGSRCIVFDTYKDSDAALFHMESLGPLMNELIGLGNLALDIHGEPSDQLIKAVAPMNPNYYKTLALL
jgi:quinol monooxygenase YgiN